MHPRCKDSNVEIWEKWTVDDLLVAAEVYAAQDEAEATARELAQKGGG